MMLVIYVSVGSKRGSFIWRRSERVEIYLW